MSLAPLDAIPDVDLDTFSIVLILCESPAMIPRGIPVILTCLPLTGTKVTLRSTVAIPTVAVGLFIDGELSGRWPVGRLWFGTADSLTITFLCEDVLIEGEESSS